MINKLTRPEPLDYGALAPQFSLTSTDGQIVTRGQFRGKSGLVLIFFLPTPECQKLLTSVKADEAEYRELNAHVIGIGRAESAILVPFAEVLKMTLLADPKAEAWFAYTGTDATGYAVFVLDLYGGVEAQKVATSLADLPDAATILEWTRGAQYKSNI